jgi:hypothetical protein
MKTLDKLLELDEKHNELLEQLAQLDARIAETLNEWTAGKPQPAAQDFEAKNNSTSRGKAA